MSREQDKNISATGKGLKAMQLYDHIAIIYLIISTIIAVATTIHDKRAAERFKYRVSENTLMALGALSGCIGMYICMKLIHHKTRKPKFMVGLPVIFVIELAAIAALRIWAAAA